MYIYNLLAHTGDSAFSRSSWLFRQSEGSLGVAGTKDKILRVYYQGSENQLRCSIQSS